MSASSHPLYRLPEPLRRGLIIVDLIQLLVAAYLVCYLFALPRIEGERYVCTEWVSWLWPLSLIPCLVALGLLLAVWRTKKPGFGLVPPLGRLALSLCLLILAGAVTWQLRGWRVHCSRQCDSLLIAYAAGAPEGAEAAFINARKAAVHDALQGNAPVLRDAFLDVQALHVHNALHGVSEQAAEESEVPLQAGWKRQLSCTEVVPATVLTRADRSTAASKTEAGVPFVLASACFTYALPWKACNHIFEFANNSGVLRPRIVDVLAKVHAQTCSDSSEALADAVTWEERTASAAYVSSLKSSGPVACPVTSTGTINLDEMIAQARERVSTYRSEAKKCWSALRGGITEKVTPTELKQKCQVSLPDRTIDCLARAVLDAKASEGTVREFSEEELGRSKFRNCEAQGTEES